MNQFFLVTKHVIFVEDDLKAFTDRFCEHYGDQSFFDMIERCSEEYTYKYDADEDFIKVYRNDRLIGWSAKRR